MVDSLLKTESSSSRVFRGVVHWWDGDPSHTLLRIFTHEPTQSVVVLASEIASNRENSRSIVRDIETFVRHIETLYSHHWKGYDREDVIWALHYGSFSAPVSYTNLSEREDFVILDLSWNEGERVKLKEETVLNESEMREQYPWLKMTAVEAVMAELTQTHPIQ